MVECPVCKKQYSEFATECPHCKTHFNKEDKTVTTSVNTISRQQNPVYLDYIVALIISVFACTVISVPRLFENTFVNCFGVVTMIANSATMNVMGTVFNYLVLFVLSAVVITIFRFIKNKQSDIVYALLALFTMILFYVVCRIISPSLISTYINTTNEAYPMAEQLIKNIPIYCTLLIPYVFISYYAYMKMGIAKGLLFGIINGVILFLILVIRIPTAMNKVESLYSFVYPLIADVLMGVFTFIKCKIK